MVYKIANENVAVTTKDLGDNYITCIPHIPDRNWLCQTDHSYKSLC